jgi:hypothetical protein
MEATVSKEWQMNEPLISVVMVVCNVERFLAESIESVLGQTFRDFEFIIVDYGSTDTCKSIISSYAAKDNRIKFHEVSICSLPAARNAGCFLAQARYIAVMDADDVCLPDRLRLEIEFMEDHPEVGLIGGAVEFVNATNRRLGQYAFPSNDQEIRSGMADHCSFCHSTVFLRKEAFTLVGGYRKAFVCAHDYDLELRIAEHFKFANLKQVVLNYRVHPHQISLRKQREQNLCKLAAKFSASSRSMGDQDPLNSVKEITPSLLSAFGITEAAQENQFVSEYCRWIRIMCMAGEQSVALKAIEEMLHFHSWKYAENRDIADLWLIAASLYRQQGRFWGSLVAAVRAAMVRPVVVGRLLKRLLSALRLF